MKTRRSTSVLKHSSTSEVLRAAFVDEERLICTSGADGYVKVWQTGIAERYTEVASLEHGSTEQVYVCEPFCSTGGSSALLTAAGNSVHLWDLQSATAGNECHIDERHFYSESKTSYGGPRNPDNVAYIFDAKACQNVSSPLYHTVAAALSDGSVFATLIYKTLLHNFDRYRATY